MPVPITEVQFGLHFETPLITASFEGEVTRDGYVLRGAGADAEGQVLEGTPTVVALQLATIAGLGPRPHAPADVPILLADGVVSADHAGLLASWEAETRAGTAIADEDFALWTAWAVWPTSPNRAKYATVTVADAGARGLARIEISELGAFVRPATSVEIWRELTTLVPAVTGDDEAGLLDLAAAASAGR